MDIRVPRRLQIGGHIYSIEYNDEIERTNHFWGTHDHRALKIEIYPNIRSTVKASTLIHEVLHAISTVYSQDQMEEDKVQSLAEGILQVMGELGITFDWGNIK